ncbi:MAG: polysaccharide biosynthesis tyrosine autokinase, partial [Leptolyngbyaceae cyanobacterium CAN_BIN12]|nr:polysaccharide biosynthesis tyrosine autokinase [Leptolyngbyaceae cyanobacterium CAN_BIN12]
ALVEYQQVQDQLAVQRTRYRPEHPEIIVLLRKEAALKQQLEARIAQVLQGSGTVTNQDLQITSLKQAITQDLVKAEAERSGLASRAAVLNQAMTNYRSRTSVLPQLEQQQRELERRLQIARSTYEQLLKRLQEVELAENQNIGNVRIVSSGRVPQKAVASSKHLSLALGGVMGILAGALTALMLDAIDKSVKTADEAQKLAGYPLLGIIPIMSGKNGNRDERMTLPARDNPCSFIGNSFEMLQTSLGFTVSDQPLQVILVASAVSGEGKSFIAANLAIATAQMGRRVLLIDADMRQPSQHRIWQQMNLKGLSDILVDQANFPEIISSPYANLDILTSGTTPPNPIALIDSKRLASLIKSVTEAYDFIIFDTPGLTLAPDALTLGKLVDGILFVVRPGVADSASVKQAKTLLAQSGQRVLGMVVNGGALGRANAKLYGV